MDILRINENSIKLMLTAEDLMSYSLSYDIMLKDGENSVGLLKKILRDAGEVCDFRTADRKLFVRIYVSPSSECEIFVRRLEDIADSSAELQKIPSESATVTVPEYKSIFVYSFSEMTPLMQTCKSLRTANYVGDSAAYKDDGSCVFYLILEEKSPLPHEYGGKLCSKNTAYYISEHCSLICRGAVASLGSLA